MLGRISGLYQQLRRETRRQELTRGFLYSTYSYPEEHTLLAILGVQEKIMPKSIKMKIMHDEMP